jgi:hypothetical protein
VTVAGSGTIRGDSGTGTGNLNLSGDTTFTAGAAGSRATLASQLAVDNTGAITGNSKLALSGATTDLNFSNISAGNTVAIQLLNDGGLTQGQTYTITLATASASTNFQRNGSGTADFLATDITLLSGSGVWTFQDATLARSGSNLVLSFTPVPEPASILAVCGLVVGVVAGVRKLRRKSTPADLTPAV